MCTVCRKGTLIIADDADKDAVAEAWNMSIADSLITEVQWVHDTDLRVHKGVSLGTFYR